MSSIAFQKWEAAGNDFFFVDAGAFPHAEQELTPSRVKEICRRENAGGADGVVLYTLEHGESATMTIWNSDGSRGDMCGNALRCLAEILFQRDGVRRHVVQLPHRQVLVDREKPNYTSVDMGEAAPLNNLQLLETVPELSRLAGATGYAVSFGNPHFVVPVETIPEDWETVGQNMQVPAHRLFSTGGINCGFVTTEPDKDGVYQLRVFERGAGATQACGSGACAASAVLAEILNRRAPHRLSLPGGELLIGRQEGRFILKGPASPEYEDFWEGDS